MPAGQGGSLADYRVDCAGLSSKRVGAPEGGWVADDWPVDCGVLRVPAGLD